MSDKKHTLGIFGGPNLLIMLASVAYIAFMSAGMASIEQPWLYVATFLLILAFCTGAKACAALKTRGHTIATPN
ncbi:hypothetical protein [Methanocella conradii]|uniref:hypothetical protein n=1 Tax=Methanocella conradii TaxID=1175444 RepID=UPI00064F5C2E|nr:hypothetical protein [Methanocella conradii]MDI6897601.1 hypothetical protein [Methanocella conradii]